jgi:Rho termination factor, N-terminal domain
MNKAELESKHLSELHSLAAEAGVPSYRMLRREELVAKLLDGKAPREEKPQRERAPRDRPPRERQPRRQRERPRQERAEPKPAAAEKAPREEKPTAEPKPAAEASEPARPSPRRPRRRRFGRRGKGLRPQDLLLPPPGRQSLVYGESREACTALLREIAAELAGASKGPDPIALLVDPSPEELAEWKREAPDAEIVAAGKARHATDALAQAVRRAEAGEAVILLVDSLSKLDDPEVAKEVFDGGLGISSASGSLTVLAALERAS